MDHFKGAETKKCFFKLNIWALTLKSQKQNGGYFYTYYIKKLVTNLKIGNPSTVSKYLLIKQPNKCKEYAK